MLLKRRIVGKVLVAIDDHAELRAPIAQVIVADHSMAEKPEDAIQGVADYG